MAGNTVKEMTTNFGKLDKFEGHDFRRWRKKMNFLLTTLKVVYVLTTPMPELLEDATVESNTNKGKELWDSLESKYMAEDSSKEYLRAQDSDKGKEVGGPSFNMTEEAGKNKHHKQNKGIAEVVKRTTQMLVVREGGLRTNPKTKVDAIAWWIDFGATTHVCKDRCWFKIYELVVNGFVLYMGDDHFALVYGKGSVALEFSSGKTITLFNVLYVPKLRKNLVSGPMLNKCGYKQVYESDKYILSKSCVFVGFGYYNNGMFILNLNKVPDDSDSVYMSFSTVVNSSLWHARLGHVHYKRMLEMSKDDLIPAIDENLEKCTTCMLMKITRKPFQSITRKSIILELIHSDLCNFHATPSLGNKKVVVRLPDPKQKTWGKKCIDCIFVGYVEHSKAYRFYIIEPNDSVSINSIIELRDAIFDENHFSLIPRPKDFIPNSDESQRDDHSDDVLNEIEPRKAMQSRDSAFWKEAIDDEIGYIMENNTWVLLDLPPGCKPLVDKTKKFLSSRFSMKEMGEVDVIFGIKIKRKNKGIVITQSHYIEKILKKFNREDCSLMSTLMDPVEKLKLNTSKLVDQLEYSRATGCFMYAIISTRPDIAYTVGRLSRFTSNPSRLHWKEITRVFKYLRGTMNYGLSFVGYLLVLEAYSDASWINHVEDSSSTSGWVFLLEGGAISWASKKQTCIIGSTMESKFVALVAAGKEAEWLKNLIHEILIWLKPIAPISIRCDSAPTMAKVYSQIYNEKSRHLGVRYSMVRELIKIGVISIEFVRTKHNLANHMTKGLARDLLPILKKGEYILWTMKMEQYPAHTNYALWDVILNGNSVVQITKDEAGNEIEVPPVTTHQILARTRENKLRALCLWPFQMSILLDSMESKMLRPCGLLSKPDLVADIKGSSRSSSNSQNVAFVSTESTSNTNELNVAYSVSTATGHSSQAQGSSSYVDELMLSFFANQSSTPQLDKEDLEQINQDDLEEIDLKWQMAMLSMRVKRFYKKTRRKLEFNGKEPVGFDKNKVECFNCHRRVHFARDCRSARNSRNMSKDVGNAGYRGRDQVEEEAIDFAFMVFTSNPLSSSSSNSEEEVTETVFDNRLSDEENSVANDRFKKDDSIYKFKISETVTSFAKDEKDAPKTNTACVEKPKEDRSSAPLIEDYETDSDDDSVFTPEHIPAKIDFVKACESVKHQALKNKGVADSECSRHMIGNKAYLADYQEIHNGGFVAFDSSRVLRVPRQSNMYSFHLQNVVPSEDLTCLFTKASIDESNLWHMRLGHVNFKTMNKLVKENLVRCLPLKIFNNDHSCIACQKGKQHKATCKAKLVSSITQPLQMLRMDLFGPASIMSINHNKYCLVVIDDFSRDLDEFYGIKEIKKEYSNARTLQQNGVAERKNKTLIKAARIMLADSLLLVTFWVEAVNTACYVLNRALVTRTHNKTPYELLNSRSPRLDFMRPFSYPATILNTLDPLGKFEGKDDEGFLVGYSITSKDFRIFNTKTRKVKENLHVRFLENKPNVAGTGPNWLFDIDSLTNSMNYIPVSAGNQTDKKACPHDTNGNADDKPTDDKPKDDTGSKTVKEPVNKEDQAYRDELDRLMSLEKEASDAADAIRKEFEQGCMDQRGVTQAGSTNSFNTVSNLVNAASTSRTLSDGGPSSLHPDAFTPANTLLHADFNNMESSIIVSPILTHKVHIDHPKDQILRDLKSSVQTKGMAKKSSGAHALYRRGTIDKTLFIKKDKDDIMLVQVYVDDIMFGSTKKSLCDEFEALMHKRFPISSMGELTFFLGLHVTQSEEGIFISQDRRLISWQCKKQTIIATSTTEVKYVAVAHCCGQKTQKIHKPRKAKKVTKLPQTSVPLDIGADEVVHQEQGDRPRRQETTLGVQMLILEDKGSGEKGGSTVDQVSTTRPEVSVATPSTPPTTTTIFGHEDLTIPQTLIKMRSEKAKEK
nr:zinc finger, CCHC-type [Tanacetum cinerariifolium]